MTVQARSSPFGSPTRTRILLVLCARGSGHVRELSRLTRSSLSVVQHALRSLEQDRLIRLRKSGRTLRAAIDPAYPAYQELTRYLRRLLELEQPLAVRPGAPRDSRAAAADRTRPKDDPEEAG